MTAPGQTMTKLRLTALTEDLCSPVQNRVFWRGHVQSSKSLGPIRGFDTEMDRADAIWLLQMLASAGMDNPRAEGKCLGRDEC